MWLVRVDVLANVACFDNAFDGEEPELPVALSLEDDISMDGVRQHDSIGRLVINSSRIYAD